MGEPTVYTHAQWRVRPGAEAAFLAAWEALAAEFTRLLAPPLWGTLVRSMSDPGLFVSFGPWRRLEDTVAMRAAPAVQAAFAALRSTCDEMTPGTYELVRHVHVNHGGSGA